MSDASPSNPDPRFVPFRGVWPRVHPDAWVAPGAVVIGDVEIGAASSVWFGCVLRGDVAPIRIGARTSIQDNTVIHATGGWSDTVVGDEVTVGHAVILHGCRVASRVLVGMGSIVLDTATIGSETILGAGSLVPPGAEIPGGQLVFGRPATVRRPLTDEDRRKIDEGVEVYVGLTRTYGDP